MVYDAHANLADTTVATAPSPATSGTSLVVAAGTGTWLPTAPFNVTIGPAAAVLTRSNSEIVRVTARTSDTLTIVRAQEGTTARTITVGDRLLVGVTAKTITDIESAVTALYANPVVPAKRVLQPIAGGLGYYVISDSGAVTGTYTFAAAGSQSAGTRLALQAAVDECGPSTPPGATGSVYVARGAVALPPGEYQVDNAPGQLYGVLAGYGCSGIFGMEPHGYDRSTATDELVSGCVMRWTGTSGTAGAGVSGTTGIAQATTATKLLQFGVPGTVGRVPANPHGAKIRDIAFIGSSTLANFFALYAVDCADIEVHDCAFSGFAGSGADGIRISSTQDPDNGGVANRIFRPLFRNVWRGLSVEGNGATDGALVDARVLAVKGPEGFFQSKGGWFVGGANGHWTSGNGTGTTAHIRQTAGGPFVITDQYFDTYGGGAGTAHLVLGGGLNIVANNHFKGQTGQTHIIDASSSTAWKGHIGLNQVEAANAEATLECFVRVSNTVNNTSNKFTVNASGAAAGATAITLTGAPGSTITAGSWLRASNGVMFRLSADCSTTAMTVHALPAAIPANATIARRPVYIQAPYFQDANLMTNTGFATCKTVAGTVLDYELHHHIEPARLINTL